MAISLVQQAGNEQSTVSSIDATLGSTPTSGNMLILAFKDNDGTSTITLPSGFAWVSNMPHGPSGRQAGIAYKVAGGSEGTTYTTSSTIAATKHVQLYEVSGLTATGAFGVATASQNSLTSKTLDSTGALAQADSFVVALADQSIDNGGEISVDEGFTLRNTGTFTRWMVADKITAATTELSPTFTWTTARASLGCTAVFYGATAAPVTHHYRAGGAWVDITRKYKSGGSWVDLTRNY